MLVDMTAPSPRHTEPCPDLDPLGYPSHGPQAKRHRPQHLRRNPIQAAQRGTAAQAEAADARQRLQSDLRIAEAVAARQARELADREREVGTLRNKVCRGQHVGFG